MLSGLTNRRYFALYVAIVFLFLVILFSPVLFAEKVIIDTHFTNASYPWHYNSDGNTTHMLEIPYFFESSYLYLPDKLNHLRTIAQGQWPLWDPYIWSGNSNLLTVQSSIFYPLHAFYLLIPVPLAFNLVNFVELLIAAIFMYLFARVLGANRFGASLAGLVFTLSLRQTAYFGTPGDFGAFVYAPAFFFTITKFVKTQRLFWLPVTALFMALALSSALPDMAMWSFLALGAYSLYLLVGVWHEKGAWQTVRTGALLLFAPTLAAALCAVWLLPFVEASAYTQRHFTTTSLMGYSLPMLLSPIFPELWGSRANGAWLGSLVGMEYDFTTLYVGVIPLLFLVIGWRAMRLGKVRFFATLSVASALFVVLISWIHPLIDWLPGIAMIRRFDRALVIYSLASSVWIALSAKFVVGKLPSEGSHGRTLGFLRAAGYILSALVVVVVIALWLLPVLLSTIRPLALWLYDLSGPYGKSFDWYWQNLSYGFVSNYLGGNWLPWLAVASASIWLLWLCLKRWGWLRILLLLVVGIDLLWPTMRYLPYSNPKEVLPITEGIRFLQSDQDMYRIATRNLDVGYSQRAVFPGMTAAAFGIQSVGGRGDYNIRYREYLERIESASGSQRSFPHQDYLTVYDSKLLDMLNAKYIVTYPSDMDIVGSKFELVYEGDLKIYQNHGALPRTWIVHQTEVILDSSEILERLSQSSFKPRQMVVLEDESATQMSGVSAATGGVEIADIVSYKANEVIINVTMNISGYLVLADNYFTGWKAEIDGESAEVRRANYVMRAVYVPAGVHKVVFRYAPDLFLTGVRISVSALALIVLLILVTWSIEWRRRVRRLPTTEKPGAA